MNDEATNLDLLDLDNDASMDALPDAAPFVVAPRPRRPWLLLGVGLVAIILATYIIVRVVGGDGSSSIEVDLDAPVVMVEGAQSPDVIQVPDAKTPELNGKPTTLPAPGPGTPGVRPVMRVEDIPPHQVEPTPTRVIEERADVKFNPDAPVEKPAAAPAPKPVAQPSAPKPAAPKPAPRPAANHAVNAYVQFGSYSSRSAADAGKQKLVSGNSELFRGHDVVVLGAVVNGAQVYRVRVGFASASDANKFCQQAKSRGLDCYVTK